jgi:very-short-patch-repair endonuclease
VKDRETTIPTNRYPPHPAVEHDSPDDANAIAASALENLRTRLLDLTNRNRLLDLRHTKSATLQIVDELPDQLFTTLYSDVEMSFLPVPEPSKSELLARGYLKRDDAKGPEIRLKKDPTAVEWAQILGIDTNYDVPVPKKETERPEKHRDLAIQTPLFPAELETRLRNLTQKAKSAVEEMGANILYLAFGFLEWFDSEEPAAKARLAPLYLLPTNLAKGRLNAATQTYQYTVRYSGEDVITNLSLREKLRRDFALRLPDLDDGTTPEDYFRKVAEMLKGNKPQWRVRRWISLALLNFSKLLMYLDLDPKNWPDDASLVDHQIVKHFLVGLDDRDQGPDPVDFVAEYQIDDWPDIEKKYPLIEDADSSQHSALIDALNGKNLVIEGPPGTGKSQTITNLIAAAMASGKTVLFVAEKLAALEVVKRRLDHAGLGTFCLELHSHKSSKVRVVEDVDARIKARGSHRPPREIAAEIAHHEHLRAQLKAHVERVNAEWRKTGKSIYEIFAGATRYRRTVGGAPKAFHPVGCSGTSFTAQRQRELRDAVIRFRDVFRALANDLGGASIETHPWFGVENTELQAFDRDQVIERLGEWQATLERLAQLSAQASDLLSRTETSFSPSLQDLQDLSSALEDMPSLVGDEHVHALPRLRGQPLAAFAKHLDLFNELRMIHQRVSSLPIAATVRADAAKVPALRDACSALAGISHSDLSISDLREQAESLRSIEAAIAEFQPVITALCRGLPSDLSVIFQPSPAGLRELSALLELVATLEPNLVHKRGAIFDRGDFDDVFAAVRRDHTALTREAMRLSDRYDLARLPDLKTLESIRSELVAGGLFRWFRPKWRAARRQLLTVGRGIQTDPKVLETELDNLIRFVRERNDFDGNRTYQELLGERFDGLRTDIDGIASIRNWVRRVRQEYGWGFGPRVRIGDAILALNDDLIRGLRAFTDQRGLNRLQQVGTMLLGLQKVLSPGSGLHDDQTGLLGSSGALLNVRSLLMRHVAVLDDVFSDRSLSLAKAEQYAGYLAELSSKQLQFSNSRIDPELFDGQLGLDPRLAHGPGIEAARRTLLLARWLDKRQGDRRGIPQRIHDAPTATTFQELASLRDALKSALAGESRARDGAQTLASLNLVAWAVGKDIRAMMVRNQAALGRGAHLDRWLDFIRARARMENIGCRALAEAVQNGRLSVDNLQAAFLAGAYDALAREILTAEPDLAQFSGTNQTSVRHQFIEYDERLKKLQREQIATTIDSRPIPSGISAGRVNDLTEEALLNHECSKKKRHLPIRKLIERAGRALVALKPCFMMGPMSVAQYLEPGCLSFDIVIMDEASQIRPEDALGTIARGSQLVVVGDPKQLPPTSFFARDIEVDEEDATALEESESILDATLPMFRQRRLRWHYRSQHEKLIAFSNLHFYENDLVLFPSPDWESRDFGLHHSFVKSGVFVNQCNLEEARVVSEAVRNHFKQRPNETLGVVTMSALQRDQIARSVEALAKEDPFFQRALEKDQERHEPIFIKNLENVQGDERDVVFISMTYGPNEIGGRVYQRFGPINSDVGWRRLNVLFTRSRKRMHVFSSMKADDILVSSSSLRGVSVLKEFLAYTESGVLAPLTAESSRQPDSDFEVAVSEALRREHFECVPQVGVAGFFIDVGVRDPGNPGRFLMGIECDGASYHSAKSVRDRDRLRQQHLERLGWRIRRIWSTDWFRNPEAQLEPLVTELHSLKTAAPAGEPKPSESQDIEAIVEKVQREEQSIVRFSSTQGSLRERLLRFDAEVIRSETPEIPKDRGLLRDEMLEALCYHRPTSRPEFFESVPQYLRSATAPEHGQYLDRVFSIIASIAGHSTDS